MPSMCFARTRAISGITLPATVFLLWKKEILGATFLLALLRFVSWRSESTKEL